MDLGAAVALRAENGVASPAVHLLFDEAQQAANAAATQPAQAAANGAPQPLDEVKGEQGQDEMDKSFDEIVRIFNKDKF